MSQNQTTDEQTRNRRNIVVGVVTSDKMQKTITVRHERLVKHPMYGKFIRRYTKYKADDPKGEAKLGDTVEIMQTRPLSRTKCWRLIKVVSSAKP